MKEKAEDVGDSSDREKPPEKSASNSSESDEEKKKGKKKEDEMPISYADNNSVIVESGSDEEDNNSDNLVRTSRNRHSFNANKNVDTEKVTETIPVAMAVESSKDGTHLGTFTTSCC
jgi:hypothetical protein